MLFCPAAFRECCAVSVAALPAGAALAGFFVDLAFEAAEPPACPDELVALDELPALCPPLGATTINAASVPASHRRNHSA